MAEIAPSPDLPPEPIHPGRTVAELLKAHGITPAELATRCRYHLVVIHNLLSGRQGIVPGLAAELAVVFGYSVSFWLNLQASYDQAVAQRSGT